MRNNKPVRPVRPGCLALFGTITQLYLRFSLVKCEEIAKSMLFVIIAVATEMLTFYCMYGVAKLVTVMDIKKNRQDPRFFFFDKLNTENSSVAFELFINILFFDLWYV